jgi:hypothetical protein
LKNPIIWDYVSKKHIAIKAIKDYKNMLKIVEITPGGIKEKRESITSPGSPNFEALSGARNPKSLENKIVNFLSSVDVISARYNRALEFLEWFEPAWNSLEDLERYVLMEFYCGEAGGGNTAIRLSLELNYSERQIYRLKTEVLDKFSMILLG